MELACPVPPGTALGLQPGPPQFCPHHSSGCHRTDLWPVSSSAKRLSTPWVGSVSSLVHHITSPASARPAVSWLPRGTAGGQSSPPRWLCPGNSMEDRRRIPEARGRGTHLCFLSQDSYFLASVGFGIGPAGPLPRVTRVHEWDSGPFSQTEVRGW